jgi:hypothetical protein
MQPQTATAVAYACKSSTRCIGKSSVEELSALRDEGSSRVQHSQGVGERGTEAVALARTVGVGCSPATWRALWVTETLWEVG